MTEPTRVHVDIPPGHALATMSVPIPEHGENVVHFTMRVSKNGASVKQAGPEPDQGDVGESKLTSDA